MVWSTSTKTSLKFFRWSFGTAVDDEVLAGYPSAVLAATFGDEEIPEASALLLGA
jgi:hypothetical protein